MSIFTIFDKKACIHTSPFFAPNKETAVRTLFRLVNDSRSDVNLFPDDYALYCVGEFHDHDGSIVPIVPINYIVDARSLLKIDKSESN